MNVLTLTQDDIGGLRDAINHGASIGSGVVVYRGILMDHRPAHHIYDALAAGEEEIEIHYEDWQICGKVE